MEIRQRILEFATQVFMRFGVRSITMDEIAGELGISKKTIYQCFSTKAEVVLNVTKAYLSHQEAQTKVISKESKDAVHELVQMMQWSAQSFKNISPNLIKEVQKYYPKAWTAFTDFQENHLLKYAELNLEKGIREGYFRKELPINFVARFRLLQLDASLIGPYFSWEEFNLSDVQEQMFDLYAHSILTPEGKQLYQQYLKEISLSL